MRTLFAFGLCLLSSIALSAQSRSITVPTVGALGGRYTSPVISRPLGGVPLPTFPAGVPPKGFGGHRGPRGGLGYFGPIYYVPNAFDTSAYYDYSTPPPPPQALPQQAPQPVQPIVINQYFGARPGDENGAAPSAFEPAPAPAVNPGDPIGQPSNYYLIAYKDHTIYSALAYWVEGNTLHYVTTQNTHNQASLSLIDLAQTAKLNADRSIPFSIEK